MDMKKPYLDIAYTYFIVMLRFFTTKSLLVTLLLLQSPFISASPMLNFRLQSPQGYIFCKQFAH